MSADPLVQFFITNNSLNSAADNGSPPIPNSSERTRYHYLNHPSTAGNYLWICFRVSDLGQDGSGNPTITVKDDTGTSWLEDTLSPVDETGNGTKLCYFSRKNCPAGVRRIEVDATAQISYAAGCGGEFFHVSAASPRDISKVGKSAASSASFASGSMTTTVTDIILHVACGQGSTTYANMFGIQAGYTCLGADMITNFAAQYNWDVAAGATNPALTPNGGTSDPNGFVSFTIGLVMDTAQGSQPSKATPRVVRAMWGDLEWSTIGSAFTSAKMQVPCRGRLLISGTQIPAGSVFSDPSNGTWTHTSEISQVGSGDVKFDYKLNPVTSSTGLLLTMSSIPNGVDPAATVCILDIECDTPLVFDSAAGVPLLTGNQGTTATLAPISITPSARGGFAMFNIAINTGTGQETTTANCYPLHPWSPQYNGGENVVAEDDIWAFMTPSSTATLTPGFTCADQGAGVKQWSAAAISFIPAVVNAPPRPLPYAMDITKNRRLRALRTRAAYSTTQPATGPNAFTVNLDGTTTSAGGITNATAAPKSGVAGSAGALAKQPQAPKSGAATSTGVLTKRAQLAKTGAVTSSSVITRAIAALKSGALTSAGALAKASSATKTGSTASSGVLAKQGQLPKAGTVSSSATLAIVRVALLALAGTVTSAGALAKRAAKSLAGSAASAGALVKSTLKPLAGATSPSATLARQTGKPLAGTVTPTGALAAVRAILLVLSGALTSSGALARRTGKSLSGSLSSAATLVRAVSAHLAGAIAAAGALARRTSKAFAGAVTPSGAAALIRAVLLAIGGTMASAGALSRSTTKRVGGALPGAGSLAKRAAHLMAGVVASGGSVAKMTARAFRGALAAIGAVVARTFGLVPPIYPGGTFTPDSIEATFTPDTIQATFAMSTVEATFTLDPSISDMADHIQLTQNDSGMTLAGTFAQPGLGALDDLTNCTIKFSLLRMSGGVATPDNPIVGEAAATFGTFDKANSSVPVSYRLQSADVANPVALSVIRWTFTLPDGGKIHGPSDPAAQTTVTIHR